MSPVASCNSKATETRESNGVAVPTLQEKNLKRKLRDLKDVTEEGDFGNCRGEKQSRPTVVAEEKTIDEVVSDDELSTQFEDTHASDGHRARKKTKPTNAQSTQTNHDFCPEQLVFGCVPCRQPFNHIDEHLDHDLKHKQQRVIRCRKCRQTFTNTVERDHHSRPHHATFAADTVRTSLRSAAPTAFATTE